MSRGLKLLHGPHYHIPRKPSLVVLSVCRLNFSTNFQPQLTEDYPKRPISIKLPLLRLNATRHKRSASITIAAAAAGGGGVPQPPLDLTEENFGQLFDTSVNITGQAELAELDGPFVKISLKGRFWHKRSTVLARLGNYLKQRIPEILEVDIEDEKQLDDSPENF
ncbi:conserved hypothetical protein [Ricinus communis]|uniref:Uncharacterized protein n=1 Tax=Ricinus communis TaxID=3988 RepID=B9RWP6_RICCO|nr:conserved hypothetical protein [Ricinus communis]